MSGVQSFTRELNGHSAFKMSFTKNGKTKKLQSGSRWGRGELEYFGTDFENGYPLAELVGPDHRLPSTCKAAQYINSKLDKEWKDILKLPNEELLLGFYGSLVDIRTTMEEPEEHEKSSLSYTNDEADQFASRSTTHPKVSADGPDDPGYSPSSPHPSGPSAMFSRLSISSRPTRATRAQVFPTSQADLEVANFYEGKDLESETEDNSEEGSSYQDRESEASQGSKANSFNSFSSDKEDKLEKNIDHAVHLFLSTLAVALLQADKDLKANVVPPEQFDIHMKEGIASASSDMTLRVSAKDHEGKMVMVRIFAEAKRKIHNKADEEILAQELAELLLAAQLRLIHGREITSTEYSVFLLSWHHMTCYMTRLTIPKDYINKLPHAQPDQLSRLSVKRSIFFKMDKPKAWIELAMALLQLVVQEFAGYERFTDKNYPSGGLVQRLLS